MKKYIFGLIALYFVNSSIYSQKIVSDPTKDETQKVTTIGNVISKKLLSTLQAELLKEMREGSPATAIDLCNIKALPLTSELLEFENNIVSIKRTSEKYRNPFNKPDSIELKVLKYFQSNWQSKPETYVQKITEDDKAYFKYYRALGVKGLCISCHGDKSILDDSVKSKLVQLYPDDNATGYKVGDFRGVISITFLSE